MSDPSQDRAWVAKVFDSLAPITSFEPIGTDGHATPTA